MNKVLYTMMALLIESAVADHDIYSDTSQSSFMIDWYYNFTSII